MNLAIETLQPNELKGKIKSVLETSKFSNSELKSMSLYNEEGLEIEKTYYEQGLICSKLLLQFEYDGICVISHDFTNDKIKNRELLYKFNKDKQLIYDRGDVITYDLKGLTTKKTRYNEVGNIEKIKQYKYDKFGNQIEKCSYDSVGILYYKSTWQYDENKNLLKWKTFDGNGKIDEDIIYIYDKKGNLIEKIEFWDENTVKERDIYKYDEKGNKTFWCNIDERHGDYCETHYSYKFDKNNNVIEILETDQNETLNLCTNYEYDSTGNIKCIKESEYDQDIETLRSIKSWEIIYR